MTNFSFKRLGDPQAEQVRPAEDWRWHLQCIEREMELLRSSGMIEVAIRNPSVAEYMKHWEGRTARAEAEIERLKAPVFDGFSVLQALTDGARGRTSAENVADVLDAVAKLWKISLTDCAQPQPTQS